MIRNLLIWLALLVLVPVAGLVVGMLAFRFHGWATAELPLAEGDFTRIVQHVGAPVVLVSTSTCPWCARARTWLDAAGVDYRDCVTDTDPQARAYFAPLGIDTVPVMYSAKHRATGFDVSAFEVLVSEAPAVAASATPLCNAPAPPAPGAAPGG